MKFVSVLIFLVSFLCFSQEEEFDPCQHEYGIKLHFKNNTLDIFETECDSILHVYRALQERGNIEWAALGVAKGNSEEARQFAMKRVQLVIDILVTLGMDRSLFVPFANTFPVPKENEPRDWPYYPTSYEYEIGVYFQPYI